MTREVRTEVHGPDFFACGIQPEPTEERVSLRTRWHSGFGVTTLYHDGRAVWDAVRYEDARSLGWLERTQIQGERVGDWKLDVEGPMTSFTLTRGAKGYWVLSASRMGFA